jgi:hypothetical protein
MDRNQVLWMGCAVAVLVAGCASVSKQNTATTASAVEVHQYNKTFTFLATLTYTHELGWTTDGPNCIFIPNGIHILDGHARAHWNTQSALDSNMLLELFGGNNTNPQIDGPSPLTLGLSNLTLQYPVGSNSILRIDVGRQSPGVSVRQQITIDLSFNYVGPASLDVQNKPC